MLHCYKKFLTLALDFRACLGMCQQQLVDQQWGTGPRVKRPCSAGLRGPIVSGTLMLASPVQLLCVLCLPSEIVMVSCALEKGFVEAREGQEGGDSPFGLSQSKNSFEHLVILHENRGFTCGRAD